MGIASTRPSVLARFATSDPNCSSTSTPALAYFQARARPGEPLVDHELGIAHFGQLGLAWISSDPEQFPKGGPLIHGKDEQRLLRRRQVALIRRRHSSPRSRGANPACTRHLEPRTLVGKMIQSIRSGLRFVVIPSVIASRRLFFGSLPHDVQLFVGHFNNLFECLFQIHRSPFPDKTLPPIGADTTGTNGRGAQVPDHQRLAARPGSTHREVIALALTTRRRITGGEDSSSVLEFLVVFGEASSAFPGES